MEDQNKKPIVLVTLTQEDLQELFIKAAEAGAKAGINKYEEALKKHRSKSKDRRYHNTKLLLRNYRMLQMNAEKSVFGRTQMKESASEILNSMKDIYDDDVIVDSIKSSATRTAIIISHVETMLQMYKIFCERSSNELDERRYDVIYGLYIADDKMNRKELARKWNISLDTTYMDEKIAIERISALIFGVDGL